MLASKKMKKSDLLPLTVFLQKKKIIFTSLLFLLALFSCKNIIQDNPTPIQTSYPSNNMKDVEPARGFTFLFTEPVEIEEPVETEPGKYDAKYVLIKEKRYDGTYIVNYKFIASTELNLSGDKKTLSIPKESLFRRSNLKSASLLRPGGDYSIHFDQVIKSENTGEFITQIVNFSTRPLKTKYFLREDSEYQEPDDWASKWKENSLSEYQLNRLKNSKINTNYERAATLNLTGDNINVGFYDTPIYPGSIEYKAVVYTNLAFPSDIYLKNNSGTHGNRMARYALDYAPNINIYEINKTFYAGLFLDEVARLNNNYTELDLDVFSSSGSGLFNFYDDVKIMIDKGVIINRSSGNEGYLKNTTASYKWKEVFFPYFYNIEKSKGAFVVVNAVVEVGDKDTPYDTIKTIRTPLGIAKHYGISVPETGVGATSQATATFSGICSLLLEYNEKHKKGFTPREIVEILLETAYDIGEKGVDDKFGHGLVNIRAALDRMEKGQKPTLDLYGNLDSSIKETVKTLKDQSKI